MSVLDSFKLDGKVALVTGSSRGLGQAMAAALAEAGADIVGLATSAQQPDTEALVKGAGRRFLALEQDMLRVTVPETRQLIDRVVSEMGRLDILVNNAGTIRRAPALDYAESDWDAVLQINLKSLFFLAQAAGNVMVKQGGGKIINIASLLSYQGGIFVPAYTASKHGVAGITRALANELARHNVNVNAIAPGYMETDNTTALRADENRSRAILERIPAGHWGSADDLKGAVVFLASDASRYVHGEILNVDGGWMSR